MLSITVVSPHGAVFDARLIIHCAITHKNEPVKAKKDVIEWSNMWGRMSPEVYVVNFYIYVCLCIRYGFWKEVNRLLLLQYLSCKHSD